MATALRVVVPALSAFASPLSSPRCTSLQELVPMRYVAPIRDHDDENDHEEGMLDSTTFAIARERVLGTRLGSPRRCRAVAAFVSFADNAEAAAELSDSAIQGKRRTLLGCRHGSPLRSAAVASTCVHGDGRLLPTLLPQSRLQRLATTLSGGLDAIKDVSVGTPPPLLSVSEPGSPSSASRTARIHHRFPSANERIASSAARAAHATNANTTTGNTSGSVIGSGPLYPTTYYIGFPIKAFTGSPGRFNHHALERAWSDMADY